MMKSLPIWALLLLLFCTAGKGQIVFNGNMTEGYWGIPLGTSAGGAGSCFGAATSINSLYAAANDNDIMFGIGADVTDGYKILLFIDSKPGGFSDGNFGRTGAPAGLDRFNSGSHFDSAFTPDYCLVIGAATSPVNYSFDLYSLSGNYTVGGGQNIRLGSITAANPYLGNDYKLSALPSSNDFTKGFEIAFPKNQIGYEPARQQTVKLMLMSISDAGALNNQFISHAGSGEGCYGAGPVDFRSQAPNPAEYNPSQSLPIDFLNAFVAQVGQAIKVFWKSASEKEMKEYQVERSNDAIIFDKIGTAPALGNTSIATEYVFPDLNPIYGKNFYRVKAVDKNGRSTYSAIMKINYGKVDNTLSIYPNPVKDEINLQIVAIKPGTYTLDIFNDAGQKLITKSIVYNGGYGLQQIPLLPNMQKGPYRLILRNKAVFYKQNFIVQ